MSTPAPIYIIHSLSHPRKKWDKVTATHDKEKALADFAKCVVEVDDGYKISGRRYRTEYRLLEVTVLAQEDLKLLPATV